MLTRTNHGSEIPLPAKPPHLNLKAVWITEGDRRTWRLSNNRNAYWAGPEVQELKGISGRFVVNEHYCRECGTRIDQPHRWHCSVGASEEGACP